MKPYIKDKCPSRGPNRPQIPHGPNMPGVTKAKAEEIKSWRRALKKSLRQEVKQNLKKDYL